MFIIIIIDILSDESTFVDRNKWNSNESQFDSNEPEFFWILFFHLTMKMAASEFPTTEL